MLSFGKGIYYFMKIKYLTGTGCVVGAVLALALAGCGPKTETTDESSMTNSISPASMPPTNEMMQATNASATGGDVRRGQYDSSLTTNLHNAAMSAEETMSNAVGVAVGEVRRGQYDTSLSTNLHNAEMAAEGATTNMADGMTNLATDLANGMSSMTNSVDTNTPAPVTPVP